MDETSARHWVERSLDVPRETMERLDAFADFLREENARQNLVSRTSLEALWSRHIADSAQLLHWAPPHADWVDLGSGAGFPGLVVAALRRGPMTLVESRKLRVAFLQGAAGILGVTATVEIAATAVERMDSRPFAVISARAFAALPRLFELGARFSTAKTLWILPKGRHARSELEAAESSWQGDFRIVPSVTDPGAGIILVKDLKRKRA